MERTRIDLAGSRARDGASAARGADGGPTSAEKRKNLILLAVAGVILLVAGYLIFASYFSTGSAPADTGELAVDSTFEEATKSPPPPEDNQPLPEPGIGKRPAGR